MTRNQVDIESPRRPLLRYYGGKWRIAPWILSHFPKHRTYCESFCGGGSILLRKNKAHCEIINDMDSRIVQVFRVLRDSTAAAELQRRLHLTPFARDEFDRAYEPSPDDDEVEQVRKTLVLSFMGYGSDTLGRGYRSGFRSRQESRQMPSSAWSNWPDEIPYFVDRLREVLIENRDGCDVIVQSDSPTTLHYVDPPYLKSGRAKSYGRHGYKFEFETAFEHGRLAKILRSLQGMVVLSGYASELYDDVLFPDWFRTERHAVADAGAARTEVLWLNPACFDALQLEKEP